MLAKKAAKKSAKKSPKHHPKRQDASKDLRRAYEHLGRLKALEGHLPGAFLTQIGILTGIAEVALRDGDAKSAADLLRAGEHLAFGSLASSAREIRLSDDLRTVIHREVEHLLEKAEEHFERHEGDRPEEIDALYRYMVDTAQLALEKGAYRRSLEFARGSEALAHVRGVGSRKLTDNAAEKPKKLRG